jgi:hypothetical protein
MYLVVHPLLRSKEISEEGEEAQRADAERWGLPQILPS